PDRTTRDWIRSLPFRFTGDQQGATAVIASELGGAAPMRRLLMGEVGSGKTVVALMAMLRTAESGAQAAFMAPTAVLAEQHAATIGRLLEGTGIRPALLTGDTPKPAREAMLKALSAGELDLIVGTHALLEDRVAFKRLALCVVDEEHRFGVRQRAQLNAKAPTGKSAHILHMSATPIPRTLSLTTYGDLDVTTLRELPSGRLPVRTELARESGRAAIFDRVREELDLGRQCFVVCPLVEESEQLEARAATTEAERLAEGELKGYEVGLLHGRMSPAQKEIAMAAFVDGRIDVLVATTVIEVGIDVPNATMMVIEGAERFGLSQLHQLRGRVGRGEHGGTCFLLPGSDGVRSRRRLAELAREPDGFRLAEIDLEMRGEGEITGTRQHGLPRFAVASLPRDSELLTAARADLDRIGPGAEYDLLLRTATARFGSEDEASTRREPR
ncbi:MAG: ATP-dependent DNA helicase RecG, partial [Actinomycetota bacterium]|nr:ATP-dependent DNA helicase RecG [Actinomycetota bacterium]